MSKFESNVTSYTNSSVFSLSTANRIWKVTLTLSTNGSSLVIRDATYSGEIKDGSENIVYELSDLSKLSINALLDCQTSQQFIAFACSLAVDSPTPTPPPSPRPPEASTNCDNVAIGEADGDTPITKDEYLEALQSIEKAITLLNERAFKSHILTDDVHYGLLSVEMQLDELIQQSLVRVYPKNGDPIIRNEYLCNYCGNSTNGTGNCFNCNDEIDKEYSCFVCGESTNAAGVCNACAWSDA